MRDIIAANSNEFLLDFGIGTQLPNTIPRRLAYQQNNKFIQSW